MVAPAYFEDSYVDHELSANLDSTYAFEGPEKLLEIWFFKCHTKLPQGVPEEGLRSIPLEQWVKLLDLVNCKILSMKSSKFMDAYLLSESSLFVFPHKIILKTCGTTTTLACIDKLFETVNKFLKQSIESKSIHRMFYSRRSFMFPEKQTHVHKDWKHEVNLLNKYFLNGKSYVVGDFNSDDHWYLYIGGDKGDEEKGEEAETTETEGQVAEGKAASTKSKASVHIDLTFEILMTELNPEKAASFITSRKPGVESLISSGVEESDLGHDVGIDTMEETELNALFEPINSKRTHLPSPSLSDSLELEEEFEKFNVSRKLSSASKFDFIHDAFSFTPCGYSSNSICSNEGGYYYTLHITPESGWSYASFETNYPFSKSSPVKIVDVLLRVLKIFEPRKFSMTLINEDVDGEDENFLSLHQSSSVLLEFSYEKEERVMYDLRGGYKLLYLNFKKV